MGVATAFVEVDAVLAEERPIWSLDAGSLEVLRPTAGAGAAAVAVRETAAAVTGRTDAEERTEGEASVMVSVGSFLFLLKTKEKV